MEISQEQIIAASPQRVFTALNDAEVLRVCIPGCESLEKTSETEMNAQVTVKVGPIQAKFAGKVVLSDINPPHGCIISGEGTAGIAGFAKGEAVVNLQEHPQGTNISWHVKAQVGGKIAQLGSRLIDSVTKKLALQFFAALEEHLQSPADEADKATPAQTDSSPTSAPISSATKIWLILTVAALIAAAVVFIGRN
ncbi:MAG: CoxG family protein [Gammaproteobacteria bacterium WSBS_2016_MAG_OTU1]